MSSSRSVALCLVAWLTSPVLAQAPSLDECKARVHTRPEDPTSYYCFVLAARGHGLHEQAARYLEEIWRAHPDRHRALLNLAVLEHQLGRERAGDHYAAAAAAAATRGDAWGVVYARTGHADWLRARGDIDAADAELEEAQAAADADGDPAMIAHVLAMRGGAALVAADPGLALRLYRSAERLAFPDGPAYLRSWILSGLAGVRWALQDHRGALSIYEREADLLRATGDAFGLAVPLVNRALSALLLMQAGQFDADEHRRYVGEALAAALEGRNRYEEARARTQMGLLLEGEPAIREFDRAASLARGLGDLATESLALRLSAREHAITGGPGRGEEAERLAGEALDVALSAGDTFGVLGALLGRAEVARIHATREEFISRSLEAVTAAERLRARQRDPEIRARVFAGAGEVHTWLATWLLATLDDSQDPEGDLALAFELLERRRARELLEALAEFQGGAGRALGGDLGDRLEAIWTAIAEVQRRLLDQDLPADARRDGEEDLSALEAEEFEITDGMAGKSAAVAAATIPRVVSLRGVQDKLAADQALLYFARGTEREGSMQIGGAGSWMLVLTRRSVEAVPLPDERDLAGPLSIYRGLIEARDPLAGRAGARIYADLLGEAIDRLPDGIARLVIVPEHDLADVPLAALSREPGLPSLAERFGITLTPSATLWIRLGAAGSAMPGSVLSLAQPIIDTLDGGAGPAASPEAADPWRGGRLAPLLETEREVTAMQRGIGVGTIRLGARASEMYLKSADLGRVGVLHLATHALIDTHRHARSAILLTPGAPAEDGLLQPREIAGLDLEGKLVVLSACSSATGEAVRGEGLMGLSHAFFQAGARTVLGTLWAVRDDEAAELIGEVADGLGRGRTVAAALAAAQRTMIRRGAPPAAWAAFVVLGDGDASLAVSKAPPISDWRIGLAGALLLAGLALAALARRLRRAR